MAEAFGPCDATNGNRLASGRLPAVLEMAIMRLGVNVGQGCAMLLDSKMQDLGCRYLQFAEVWGFIGKKERHLIVGDNPEYGDLWTFCH
jgi:hypothetical protein